jgi:hypothetical protein
VGKGRGNNLLRLIYDQPLREEEAISEVASEHRAAAEAELNKTVRPILPSNVSKADLRKRLDPATTLIMTCGNPSAMEDIGRVAKAVGAAFTKEEW